MLAIVNHKMFNKIFMVTCGAMLAGSAVAFEPVEWGGVVELGINAGNYELARGYLGELGENDLVPALQDYLFDASVIVPARTEVVNDRVCQFSNLAMECHDIERVIDIPAVFDLIPNGRIAYIDVMIDKEEAIPEQLIAEGASISDEDAFLVSPMSKGDCDSHYDASVWPIDVDKILRQISLSMNFTDAAYTAKTILILDTGFYPTSIPNRWAFSSQPSVVRIPSLSGTATYVDGLNLAALSDNPNPPIDFDMAWHGMSVADVALGTRQLHELRNITPVLPRVAFASNMRVFDAQYQRIVPSSISMAYRYADDHDFPVINVSFLVNERIASIEDALRQNGDDVLMVVAAGNDGLDVEGPESWPAMLGGIRSNGLSGAILTVGSHEPDGSISDFSRYSERRVDLLAPGCGIPTVIVRKLLDSEGIYDIRSVEMSGTSYSAPLVSFTGAILAGFGIRPLEIKDRINITTNVKNELDGFVMSRGLLNIEDALAFPFVVYRFDKGDEIGRLLAYPLVEQLNVTLCGAEYRLNELAKIAKRVGSDGNWILHIWEKGTSGSEPHGRICEMTEMDNLNITLRSILDEDEIVVSLDEMTDFIMPL